MHKCADKIDILCNQIAALPTLSGVTIIDNIDFANRLVQQGVKHVVLRLYNPNQGADIQEGNYQTGRDFFYVPSFWNLYQHTDPRVILQYMNEGDVFIDNAFYTGMMQSAVKEGRRIVIFNDSVGTTELPHWQARREALTYARDHRMFVGIHTYGMVDAGWNPICAPEDSGPWHFYGGRWQWLYASMPDVQPDLILTECGPGASELQKAHGFPAFWDDFSEFNRRAMQHPYLVSYHWWSAGCNRMECGFQGDSIDDFIPQLAEKMNANQ